MILNCICGYDGKICDNAIPFMCPKEDKNGNWEICIKCKRNHSVGACKGYFELIKE